MRLPDTTTLFALLTLGILLLVVLTAVPGVDVPDDLGDIDLLGSSDDAPPASDEDPNGLHDLRGVAGLGALAAIIAFTLLLLRRMPR